MIREAVGQLRPRAAAGLVERLVAGFVRQQKGMGADKRRQRRELIRRAGMGVEMHHGLGVAVHVEHHVGLLGKPEQSLLHDLGRVGGLPGFEFGAQSLADEANIGLPVGRQLALDALGHLRHEMRIAAVEIDAVA
jgi:hypothetical protein